MVTSTHITCIRVMSVLGSNKNILLLLAIAAEHGKRATRAHKQQVVSDWLKPHSLETMSAFGSIEDLA